MSAVKLLTLNLLIFLFAACSIFRTEESMILEPRLLKQAPLPQIPESIQSINFSFLFEMIVDENGNVEYAKLLESSGDRIWDSLTVLSLYEWKFSPAKQNGKPVKAKIRRKVNVLFLEPREITLAEIILNNREEADSIFKWLKSGYGFDDLAEKYSLSPTKKSGGQIGRIDINHYSDEIRRVLSNLQINEFTKPLLYGNYFAIFKRLKDL